MAVPDELCDTERTARIACCRLNPDVSERSLSQQSAVADTVQRHTACEAQILRAGLLVDRARHAQHDLFAHNLDRAREVHFPLRELRLRDPRRPAEQAVESAIRHGEAGEVIEVPLVQRERAVLTQVDELAIDRIHIFWLAIGSQAHELVLARIDLETGVIGECGVEQPQGIGPAQFLQQFDVCVATHAKRSRRPFPHAVDRQDRGFAERRGKECARRVGLVMLGVKDVAVVVQGAPHLTLHEQLVLDPEWACLEEGDQTARRDAQIGLEDALELQQGLVVETHIRQVLDRYPAGPEAVIDSMSREGGVPLLASEPLLLRRGDDLAVSQEAARAVVVERRYTEDVRGHALGSRDTSS